MTVQPLTNDMVAKRAAKFVLRLIMIRTKLLRSSGCKFQGSKAHTMRQRKTA